MTKPGFYKHWKGELVRVLFNVRQSTNGEVVNASSQVNWDQAAKAETRRLQIVAERVAKEAVPPLARVHPWKWDRREAKFRLSRKDT